MRADPPVLRRAVRADIPAMAAVVNGWIDTTPWFPRVHGPEAIEGFIRDAFPIREIWVIGEPVEGYLSVDPAAGRVAALYCARTGAGLGKRLLDRAKLSRTHLTLRTHRPNAAAQRFYVREGLVAVGEAVPEPPDTVPELVMEWRA
jgi:hypothetical protein